MKTSFPLSKIAAALTVVGGVSFFSAQTMAAAPLAGTNISNVATATYTDNTGTERVVTSNEVKTIVAQVGSFTLETHRTAQTTPNGQVSLPHILTNTGNGTDKFKLDLTNSLINAEGKEEDDKFDFTKYAVYLDRNKDGVPDDSNNLSGQVVELNAGESIGLVVLATTPSDRVKDDFANLKLTATSQNTSFYADEKSTEKYNVDKIVITTGAVMQITKAASINTVSADGIIEYTLTFKNTGNAPATNVAIFDILPDNVTYYENKSDKLDEHKVARYSSKGELTSTDLDDDNFIVDGQKVLLNIASIAPNTTGTLKFFVKVNKKAQGSIKNTAYVDPDGKNGSSYTTEEIKEPTSTTGSNDPKPSNETIVTILGKYDGSINDSKKDAFKDDKTPTVEGAVGDDVISLEGQQGLPVVFGGAEAAEGSSIVVHNSGNSTDTYNLTITESTLPKGSIVEILKADGKTPAVDTNGDGIVDTGPIEAAKAAEFTVRITLPTGQVITGPVGVTLSSKSVNDPTLKADTLKLVIQSLIGNKVDLVNKDKGEPVEGEGTGTGISVDTNTTSPGTSTTFDITIENQGNVPDNYIITVPNVPNGWTVDIFEKVDGKHDGACTSTKVTNSGNIYPPNSKDEAGKEIPNSKSFCVTVTPPAGTPAGTDEKIHVEISSPSTGTKDNITFNVIVEEQRQLSFTPDRQGQVAPGGTIVYTHTLTNTGNVTEGDERYPLSLTMPKPKQGENVSVYIDVNRDGILDANELVQFTASSDNSDTLTADTPSVFTNLPKDGNYNIYVKVESPATATAGEAYTHNITVVPTASKPIMVKDNEGKDVVLYTAKTPDQVSITDRTVVTLGQVRLTKMQALSTDCETATDYVTADLKAAPGQCVFYKITAVNEGNEDAKTIVISDSVPSYTTFHPGTLQPTAAKESNGQISYTVDLLKPAESVDLQFGVKVDTETK